MALRILQLLLAAAGLTTAQEKIKALSADELKDLLGREKSLFFLDVREPDELERLGTIKGYVNIPLGQIESRLGEIPKDRLIVTA
ncbi:MAG: rhodanese-like domain-containing protein [Bryobacteraceae bacterium]